MAKASNVTIRRLSGRVLLATWAWTKANTKGYKVRWWYKTAKSKVAILGNETEVNYTPRITVSGNKKGAESKYTMPEDATEVWFHVKPYTETTKTVKKKKVIIWTADWSTKVTYKNVTDNPAKPPTPSIRLADYVGSSSKGNYELYFEVSGLNADDCKKGTIVQWQVYEDDNKLFHESKSTLLSTADTRCCSSCFVNESKSYKVRCKVCRPDSAVKGGYKYSEWSEYSSVIYTPLSKVSSSNFTLKAETDTSILVTFTKTISGTISYDIQYSQYSTFDQGSVTDVNEITNSTKHIIRGLETGKKYYVRIRRNTINHSHDGVWSDAKTIILGKKPAAPTTWSSVTVAKDAEPVNLYWVHNSEDNSSQTRARLYFMIDGVEVVEVVDNNRDEEHKDDTSVFKFILGNEYPNVKSGKLEWCVKTAGIYRENNEYVYSDKAIKRVIDFYLTPSVTIEINDVVDSFPIQYRLSATSSSNQNPIGYYITIVSNSDYQTLDNMGNTVTVKSGDVVYSKHIETTENIVSKELTPSDIMLENNMDYTIKCVASFSSGLTAESIEIPFQVLLGDDEFDIDAEIIPDEDALTCYIRPYCVNEENEEDQTLSDKALFSVYRREFDGTFTAISENKPYTEYVVDPHPALDYARYRIVATSKNTGNVFYYDPDIYPIQEKAAVIQWDDTTNNFSIDETEITEEDPWSGYILKLPYNLDVADNYNPDVSLVEYVGREHPVSYYGTHIGSTATWNVDIVKEDIETLYLLRRLARWMGDVYVREPSGSGYWANVVVSFSQKHCELVIPVTLQIRRVEGGK